MPLRQSPVVTIQVATTKAGSVASGSFSGSPLQATVSFSANFPNTNYSVTVTPVPSSSRYSWSCAVRTKSVSGFTIDLGSSDSTGLTAVDWIASSHG